MKENYTPVSWACKVFNRTLRVYKLTFLVCLFGLYTLPVDAKHSQLLLSGKTFRTVKN